MTLYVEAQTNIPFTKYININSQVAGNAPVQQREFIGRLFTTNPLLPTHSYIEFTNSFDVGVYFGTDSEEYLRSVPYFSRISKKYTRATKISFYRWVDTATAPLIYGTRLTKDLAYFQAIDDGSFQLTLGTTTHQISGLDFTSVLSFADIASILESGIQAADVATQWANATVDYDNTSGGFDFVGGDLGPAAITDHNGTVGTNIVGIIGWVEASGAIFSNGSAQQSVTQVLQESSDASNNFGSFLFMPAISQDQAVAAATWNAAQDTKYMFNLQVDLDSYVDYQAALATYAGTALVIISPTAGQYADQYAMIIFASTDYTRANSVQNYQYQQFPDDTPSVTDGATSDALDAVRVNYLGRTQEAGGPIIFYQEGVLQGGLSDPIDMNVYANEVWLKSAMGVAIMTLLLTVSRLPANDEGATDLAAIGQLVINQALKNGTISVGKPLTSTQIAEIGEISENPNAWYQVQNIGYWFNTFVNPTDNSAGYTLIYSKDDAVRTINADDFLI